MCSAERRRARPGVDQHVEHRAAGAAHQLGLAAPAAQVQPAHRALPRPRLAVLHELLRRQPVLAGDRGVEGPGEEAAVVVVGLRQKHQHPGQRHRPYLHVREVVGARRRGNVIDLEGGHALPILPGRGRRARARPRASSRPASTSRRWHDGGRRPGVPAAAVAVRGLRAGPAGRRRRAARRAGGPGAGRAHRAAPRRGARGRTRPGCCRPAPPWPRADPARRLVADRAGARSGCAGRQRGRGRRGRAAPTSWWTPRSG